MPSINTEKKVEMEFRVESGQTKSGDVAAMRKTIEEAARRIPDAALKGLKSFRIIAVA
jgi:hypothetical protein